MPRSSAQPPSPPSALPHLPLYLSFGFQPLEDVGIPLPDGLSVAGVAMDKRIEA